MKMNQEMSKRRTREGLKRCIENQAQPRRSSKTIQEKQYYDKPFKNCRVIPVWTAFAIHFRIAKEILCGTRSQSESRPSMACSVFKKVAVATICQLPLCAALSSLDLLPHLSLISHTRFLDPRSPDFDYWTLDCG